MKYEAINIINWARIAASFTDKNLKHPMIAG
jgi:hypothetical protein